MLFLFRFSIKFIIADGCDAIQSNLSCEKFDTTPFTVRHLIWYPEKYKVIYVYIIYVCFEK